MKPFFMYILRCADASYYVGHTDDLETRLAQHQAGLHPGYTSRRRPVVLLHAVPFATRDEALARERQIKGWSRAKKEALMREDWASLQRLARRPSTAALRASAQGERGGERAR